ncbi:UDP binding domain-containing protein, partial [Catellatospora tritici]|uniref:UDP binding domain-containing protein n=1 Tax=Catellatospora tritici TaxID=2851566 RepID=UPI0020C5228A
TYKPNIADKRESPATPLARALANLGAKVSFHDPYVQHWDVNGADVIRVDNLEAAVTEADLVILVQRHREYDADHLASLAQRFFDTRGATTTEDAHRL